MRRRAEHSDCRAAHCYHITTSPRCRASNSTSSPSYHITKSLTTQPTKHTTKSPTSRLPPQTHNTHQNISPHSHNTTQSTTTLLATYHHPISPKKSLITQPTELTSPNSIKTATHTTQTNCHHTQTNHLPTHHTSHLPPKTHDTHQNIFLSLSQHNSINYHSTQLHPQNHLIKQTPKNT